MTFKVRTARAERTTVRSYTTEDEAREAFDRQLARHADTHRRTGGRPTAGAVMSAHLAPVRRGERPVVVDLVRDGG